MVTSGAAGSTAVGTTNAATAAAVSGWSSANNRRTAPSTAVSFSRAAKCSSRRYSLSAVAASWDTSVS